MVFALGTREHFRDVVETADETRAEAQAFGQKPGSRLRRVTLSIQASPENLVHELFERNAAGPPLPFEARGHVVVERQRGAHIMMFAS